MVKIIGLDHMGRGIGKIDNKIIFIDNALIDEEVEVNTIINKASYMEGEVSKYIKTSPNRVEVKCPYYDQCGGCDLLHMSYEDELTFKLNKVKDILNRYCHIDNVVSKIIKSDREYNYRNKATFKVKDKLGYYRRKSNEIVLIGNCLLLDKRINDLILPINKLDLSNVNEVMIRAIDKVMVSFMPNIEQNEMIKLIDDMVIDSNQSIVANIGDIHFIVSGESFFQVNTNQINNLYNQILNYLSLTGKETVLDLYCGTGTIGIYVSKYANKVIGVEINKQAIEDANKNKELNKINNTQFINSDVDNLKLNEVIDRIIVDPPRSGLSKNITNKILELNPEIIVYVSCNPMTLARDINNLSINYEVKEVTLIDMFPKTYHVEGVVKLLRKSNYESNNN